MHSRIDINIRSRIFESVANNHKTTMTMRWHDIPDDPDEEAELRDEEARDMADELREDE
jgi:hypothetical protein